MEIDPTVPSSARMYDYYLGGTDNFPADREAAERILALEPGVRENTRANRGFLVRAVRMLAGRGVTQYIDLGTGIPTSPNVHEVARETDPDARIVYVDNDPIVTAHNRPLNETHDGIVSIEADIRRPSNISSHPDVQRTIDFTRPIAVLVVSLLHFFDDTDARRIVDGVGSWMSSGSYLVLSANGSEGASEEEIQAAADVYERAGVRLVLRSREELAPYFDGYDLLDPGLVPVQQWHADEPPTRGAMLAGVGRVP